MAGEEQGGALISFSFFALIIGINIVVIIYQVMRRRRADAICKELIENSMGQIKMIADSMLVKSATFNQKGLLVMMPDRLVFAPLDQKPRLEMPFNLLERLEMPRANLLSRGLIRKVVVYLNGQKLQFTIGPYVFPAWQAGLEKLVPQMDAAPIR